jgi:peptidoglycan LD-endopeptidase LytH
MRLLPPLLLILLLLPLPARAAAPWTEWNDLYVAIRDETIAPGLARKAATALQPRLRAASRGAGSPARVFPVAGYGPECGEKGRNYQHGRYDYYGSNRKGLHPAHDLFIHDPDQDGRDDATGQPVTVVAFSAGMVVATNTGWLPASPLKGGNYVWIYDPATDRFCYYAHLARVDVRPGDRVRAGAPLGLLGRTGKNAYARRSPTHLHFMVLAWDQGRMTPVNPWPELLRARVVPGP